jgi:hypothetical protein
MRFMTDEKLAEMKAERETIAGEVAEKIANEEWPKGLHGLVMLRDGYLAHVEECDRRIREAVNHLRFMDASWAEIGKVLGVSKQAAQKRFADVP